MDVLHLQDRVNWGLNRAAKVLGHATEAYRPCGPSDPLALTNRYLRLNAAFSHPDGVSKRAVSYGSAVWRGYFDAAYTQVGDYLSQGHGIWFVAAQQSLAPVLCVRTNRVISITRTSTPATGDPYGSGGANTANPIISNWPASVLGIGGGEKSPARLPGDTTIPVWVVLLPAVHQQIVRLSDIITDEQGVTGTVIAAEQTELGWRLNIRQVTT